MTIFSRLSKLTWIALASSLLLLATSCKPDGFINKVKYDGEKYVNTCETFKADIEQLIAKNNEPLVLKVSEYDNTDFRYFYLEPGQFEQVGDSLIFRLAKDLNYNTYLAKRVAVHVNASAKAPNEIARFGDAEEVKLGTLVVDEAYFAANKKPYFSYKFPLNGQSIAGKQIMLTFAIAKYDKNGNVKEYFCESDANPIGTAMPACCTAKRWDNTQLQTAAELPKINAQGQQFKYESFTGTIDVQFEESSANIADDSTFDASLIQYYVDKYKGFDYGLDRVDMTGYASPGGKEKSNQKLSEERAESLKEGLQTLNEGMEGLEVTAVGKGEDWERVKLLTEISSLDEEQQAEVLAICNDTTLTNDQKEATLRNVAFWETLVEEVLVKARHTFTIMDFDYDGATPTLKRYVQRHPVASSKMEEAAAKVFDLKPADMASDKKAAFAELDKVLTETASSNLYALRATYHVADEDYKAVVDDLEKATRFRGPDGEKYVPMILGYKVLFADEMGYKDQVDLYDQLAAKSKADPDNHTLSTNKTLMMDKIGYLDGALKSYDSFVGAEPSVDELLNRGVTKAKSNMITAAEADFKAVLAKEPNNGNALFNLAALSAYRGLTFKTIDYLDKAIAVNPGFRSMVMNNPVFSVLSEDSRFDKYRE